MSKMEYFMKKHSTTILAVIGSMGVAGTAVLAVRATPKALSLINEAKDEKGNDLTVLETIKVAWKPYVPAVIVGVTTVVCIMGSNRLSTKHQACLASAYALLDNSYREYRNKVKELSTDEDIDAKVKQEIAKSSYEDNSNNMLMLEHDDNEIMFFDYQAMRFFKSDMDTVMQAENKFLELYNTQGFAYLNDYYDCLGIPRTEYGSQLGWFFLEENDPYNCHDLAFDYSKTYIGDGIECCIITTSESPALNYFTE